MLHPDRVVEHQSASSCRAGRCVVVRVHGLWIMPSVRFVLCSLTEAQNKKRKEAQKKEARKKKRGTTKKKEAEEKCTGCACYCGSLGSWTT